MKYIIVILLLLPLYINAQVNDSDVARALLGKQVYEINPILDSLGVWHHLHMPEKIKNTTKIMSIEIRSGSTKVYTLRFGENYERFIVESVTVNFRHTNRNHIEDATNVKGEAYHVGKYSTDIDFFRK